MEQAGDPLIKTHLTYSPRKTFSYHLPSCQITTVEMVWREVSALEFEHWDKLIYGIERGECILFLGPQIPLELPDGGRLVPTHDLAVRLLEQLDKKKRDLINGPNELAQISQSFLAQEGEVGLEMEISRWNEEFREKPSPLHADLAALPFRLIVTSSHDSLMETALSRVKQPSLERYHYKGKNKELLPEANVDTPTLFHLYGCISEPASVVITETQLLDFLAALISKDPPLPNDLNAALTNGRLFLFLGFGLNQWYLRILLHVLKVLRQGSRTFAVELGETDFDSSVDDAVLFYRQNFKVDIYQADVCTFVSELRRRCTPYTATDVSTEAPQNGSDKTAARKGPTVFICHASEDKEHASAINDGLAQAGFDPWLDKESLRGGDQWDPLIESTIGKVNYFVVLNSHNLHAKSKGASYVNKEIKVALRAEDWRMGKFIIPVIVDDSPLLDQLSDYHAVDFTTKSEGLRDLVRAMKRDAEKM